LATEIPELKDVITGELATTGKWLVANVDTKMSWTLTAQKVRYRGADLWVLPVTKGHYPGVTINRPSSMPREDAERLIMQFLSALSWSESHGVLVEHFSGGPRPNPMGRQQQFGFTIQTDFDFSYLPEPTDEKAMLALALMREGRGLNHPAYAFLSFYRVLEVAFEDGKKRGAWMAANIDTVRNPRAQEAITKLKAAGVSDIGMHLQKSSRQAIAHARQKPIINPDDPTDARRLNSELPLMDSLATLAIESEMGVETRMTVYSKHLYELEGFKTILGQDIVATLIKGEEIKDCKSDIPLLSIELRRRNPYTSLSNLRVVHLAQAGSTVMLVAQSLDNYFQFRCQLDFAEERLYFDVTQDLGAVDDGSFECAIQHADFNRFIYHYLGNGQLYIVNAETQTLISRKDAFIPMNCYVNSEACEANIERWLAKAEERRKAAAASAK